LRLLQRGKHRSVVMVGRQRRGGDWTMVLAIPSYLSRRMIQACDIAEHQPVTNGYPRHREWLQRGYDLGLFLCSGTKEPPSGDYLVTRAGSIDSLKTMFEEEPCNRDTDFSPPAGKLPSIGAICRRLDGIPLGIEFAAAQAAVVASWILDQSKATRSDYFMAATDKTSGEIV
jgi:uncharacterized protein YciI